MPELTPPPKATCIFPNKDFLLGFIHCIQSVQKGNPEWKNGVYQMPDGSLTPSNEPRLPIMEGKFFDLTCECGYYIAFATPEEIPEVSLKCPLCEERYLLLYTQPYLMFEVQVVFDKVEIDKQIKKDFARYILSAGNMNQARQAAQNALLSLNKNIQKIDNITVRPIGNFLVPTSQKQ